MDVIGQNGNDGLHYDEEKEVPAHPLEAWKQETEKEIEETGMDKGDERPNPSADGGPASQPPSEYPVGRK